jgi:hypothetical protein
MMSDNAPRSGKPASATQSESVSSLPFLVLSSLAFVLSVAVVAISSLFGTAHVETATGGAAHAEPLKPAESRNIDLGRIAGAALYTVEREIIASQERTHVSSRASGPPTPIFVLGDAPRH